MVLLQNERLKIVGSLALAGVLKAELRNFTVKINLRGHASFEAGAAAGDLWREGAHDDLILAVALGCWYAEHGTPAAPSIWSPFDD